MKIKILLIAAAALALAAAGSWGYVKVMARYGSGMPPPLAEAAAQADQIIVSKADKTMYLLRGERILQRYRIAMGAQWDAGHKQREGDEKTPEGRYEIDWRNPQSVAHLSLHISYPNAADSANAQAAGQPPGGNIMIHGLPNGLGLLGFAHHLLDWTDGCIAVTNDEMRQIWSLVPNGTPITIHPQWQP